MRSEFSNMDFKIMLLRLIIELITTEDVSDVNIYIYIKVANIHILILLN